MNHQVSLRYRHHHPVLLLQVAIHLDEVEVGPALEEDDGGEDSDSVQDEEEEEVGDGSLDTGCSLIMPVTVANVTKNSSIVSCRSQEETSEVTM